MAFSFDLNESIPNVNCQDLDQGCNCCCQKSQDITFEICEDVKDFTIQDVRLNCEGRFLKIRVELDRVCSGRNVTVGVLLCENISGTFLLKGFRVCEIEIPNGDTCQDNVPVGEFCFILPEENLCSQRTIRVNVIAYYSSFPSFPFCPC